MVIKIKKQAYFIIVAFLAISFAAPIFPASDNLVEKARADDATSLQDDFALYQKYRSYLDYQKKQNYLGYKKYKKYKKYRFKNESVRANYQTLHNYYRLYQSDPAAYAQYKKYKKKYLRYEKYLNYFLPYQQYASYKNLKRYNKKKYNIGANYGGQEYLDGYNSYLAAQGGINIGLGEADLGGGPLGPEISVGLTQYSRKDLQDNAFKIKAKSAATGNPAGYAIKDESGAILATIDGAATTKVKYLTNKNFSVYESVADPLTAANEIRFEAADPANADDIIFDFNRPSTNYDQYRGKIVLKYYNNPDGSDQIWAINKLPMEHYVWGMGEMTGTGPMEHSKVMTTVFRTYGYWKIKFSTKYALQGFKVNATPGNQIYYGYDWEIAYPNIRLAAEGTSGKLVMYNASGKNEIALTPYSSWTDGRTRSFEERWGSKNYPWCKSVKDKYGKNSSMSTAALEADGNHMVGLSAHGSLKTAGDGYKWDWQKILKYYFTGINLLRAY